MFAFDLLHRQLSYRVLLGREMPLIDTRLVGVIPGDAKRRQQSAEFQEHRILASTYNIREHSPCVMIERMPEPPRGRFGPDETPHLIQLDGALWPAAADAFARGCQHAVGVLQRGGFFVTAITVVGLIRNTRAVSRTPLPLRAISTTWRRTSSTRPRLWYCRRKIRRAHCPF